MLLLGVWIGRGGVAHAAFNTPAPINFGNVVVTQSSDATTMLSATMPTSVTVDVVRHGGDDCSQFQILSPTTPVLVDKNTSPTVTVRFSPTSPGDKTCTIDVNNNQNGSLITSFAATGHAAAPQIGVDPPTTLPFGNVDVGSTSPAQTVTTNIGDAPLAISSATFTAGASDYLLMSGPATATVQPGNSVSWTLQYRPSTRGSRSGMFEIASDSFNNKTFDVTLSCTGQQGLLMVGGGCNAGDAGRGAGLATSLVALGWFRRRRRRGLAVHAIAAATAMLAIAPTARADGIGVTAFAPTPATTGAGFALQAPDVGAHGTWVANAVVSYASNPLVLGTVTATGPLANALVGRSTLMQLGAAYALLDRFCPSTSRAANTRRSGNPPRAPRLATWRCTPRPGCGAAASASARSSPGPAPS